VTVALLLLLVVANCLTVAVAGVAIRQVTKRMRSLTDEVRILSEEVDELYGDGPDDPDDGEPIIEPSNVVAFRKPA
jgi:hypothetical protein